MQGVGWWRIGVFHNVEKKQQIAENTKAYINFDVLLKQLLVFNIDIRHGKPVSLSACFARTGTPEKWTK